MAFQAPYLPSIKRINVDSCIFGASSDVLVVQELNAKDRIAVICLHSLPFAHSQIFAEIGHTTLLVGTHTDAQVDWLFRLSIVLVLSRVLVVGIARIVNIKRPHFNRLMQGLSLKELRIVASSFPFCKELRSDHIR